MCQSLKKHDENSTFCGKPFKDMTREELIKALIISANSLDSARKSHQDTLKMWELCRQK